jgi:hypothetical protein
MNDYRIGIALMVAGAVLFLVGRVRSNRTSVSAKRGSVAVGRDSVGPITNINVRPQGTHAIGGHGLTIISIVVEIVGICAVIWHTILVIHK